MSQALVQSNTTTQLAIQQYTPMKHLKVSCQKYKMDSLLLSSRCVTNYMKSCSFLHAHFFELLKVVEIFFLKKAYGENSFTKKTYDVGSHWNCLIEAIPMCTYNIIY